MKWLELPEPIAPRSKLTVSLQVRCTKISRFQIQDHTISNCVRSESIEKIKYWKRMVKSNIEQSSPYWKVTWSTALKLGTWFKKQKCSEPKKSHFCANAQDEKWNCSSSLMTNETKNILSSIVLSVSWLMFLRSFRWRLLFRKALFKNTSDEGSHLLTMTTNG